MNGKDDIRIRQKNVFSFAEHEEQTAYVFPFNLTIKKNSNNAVLIKADTIADAKIAVKNMDWYVEHYTSSIEQQANTYKQILSITTTEIRYIARSVF